MNVSVRLLIRLANDVLFLTFRVKLTILKYNGTGRDLGQWRRYD